MKGDKDKDATSVERDGNMYSYSMRAPETAKDEFYKDIGFQSKGIQREGISSQFDDGKVTHVIMSGTLWVEGNVTEESLYGYEKISGGVDHAKKVISAGHTTERGFMQGQTKEGNYAFAAEFLNDKYGNTGTSEYTTTDGTKADASNYDTKKSYGLWKKYPDSDYPNMYYRTINYYKKYPVTDKNGQQIVKNGKLQWYDKLLREQKEGYDAETGQTRKY